MAEEAQIAGFVNAVVSPGHTETEARKVAREICRLPALAVAISRKLLRGHRRRLTRRMDQVCSASAYDRMKLSPPSAATRAHACLPSALLL